MNDLEMTIDKKDLERLLDKLSPKRRLKAITEGLKQSGFHLQRWIKSERLSGPRPLVLGVVSGRLRSSIAVSKVEQDGNDLSITIGTNVKYARRHEFGFNGSEYVHPHIRVRRQKIRMFGTTRNVRTGPIFVDGFTRQANVRARPFLRPAIENRVNQMIVMSFFRKNIQEQLEKQ